MEVDQLSRELRRHVLAVTSEEGTRVLRRRALLLRVASLWILTVFCCVSLFALDPNRAIDQLAHRFWGEREGYPGLPYAMAQTKDGYLWLGTSSHLYRFDGVHFEIFEPVLGGKLRSESISGLLALPDGRLWIGYLTGGISVLQNGAITTYGESEG